MRVITKREYQVISLYARGLKFREIGLYLGIATRTAINYYMRVKTKDKGRVTRAKKSRAFNKSDYSQSLHEMVKTIRAYNASMMYYSFTQHKVKSLTYEIRVLRSRYIKESLEFAHKSYNRFKLHLLKKSLQKCTP